MNICDWALEIGNGHLKWDVDFSNKNGRYGCTVVAEAKGERWK
jgi:hypothetical protein